MLVYFVMKEEAGSARNARDAAVRNSKKKLIIRLQAGWLAVAKKKKKERQNNTSKTTMEGRGRKVKKYYTLENQKGRKRVHQLGKKQFNR